MHRECHSKVTVTGSNLWHQTTFL